MIRKRSPHLRARLIALVSIALALFTGALVANLLRYPSRQLQGVTATPVVVDIEAASGRLAYMLSLPTVSHQDTSRIDRTPFNALRAYLPTAFPAAHGAMTREEVDGSLLYKWTGTDSTLRPVLLMAHMDVVPGEEGGAWTHPPFSGARTDGFIWGRGALDVKSALGGMMEAVEILAAAGHRPRRTVYFAFGHDEEIGGSQGNGAIAARLKAQGIKLHAVLDEGSVVTVNVLPNVTRPVALIGIAEKGYLTLELSVEAEGGHSSMPAIVTNVEVLAQAITRVTAMRNEGMLTAPVREQLTWLAPELGPAQRLVLSNLWLFEDLVKKQMSQKPSSDAMLRTTIAPTMLRAGDKENVLPHRAAALVNFRLLPGTTVEQVVTSVRKRVGPRVKVEIKGLVTSEPSTVSETHGPAFDDLHRSIRETYPEALVAPSLVLGATDSRHYRDLTDHIYRFIPVRLASTDIARIHGRDERIAVRHYQESIAFYVHYLRRQ